MGRSYSSGRGSLVISSKYGMACRLESRAVFGTKARTLEVVFD